MTSREAIPILVVEDDPDDRLLTRDALREIELADSVYFVEDGVELMDYLYRRGRFEADHAPTPGIILLDLNMPRKGGREVLQEIKMDPELRRIPVVVLTTSKDVEDITRSYDLGVSSFIVKPVTFAGLVAVMTTVAKYWFETVALPPRYDA